MGKAREERSPVLVWQTNRLDGTPILIGNTPDLGDGWQPLPGFGDIPLSAPVVGSVAVSVPQLEQPVVAFVEATDLDTATLRVWSNSVGWVEEPSIDLGALPPGGVPGVSVAARAGEIFVAFAVHSGGSYDLRVMHRAGDGWQQLGGDLDVDTLADAQAPALAIDADGMPIVAWRERFEGNWRGLSARWDGSSWTASGDAWNTATDRAIAQPRIALWRHRVPVITWGDTDGQGTPLAVHVAQLNGLLP
jgi:hypothetical protein